MANVFANGREISCKAGSGKSICAFPDVCFTPPTAPPTPPGVPIPYPNTGMASDTTSGSKKVKISKKEVMLKNKSYFKSSTGDEAGSAPKKGVITSKIKGKVYFNVWSMDVKVEGENVVRHLDLTTHNHASQTGQTPPWPQVITMAPSGASPGEVEVKCRDDWDDCQKKQMCGKVASMNKAVAQHGPLHKRDVTPQLKKVKASWQAKYRRDNPVPGGKWTDDCAKTNGKPVQADHVVDVQWGGHAKGPFEYLDASVNMSIGSQMDKSTVNPATGFKATNCGCP
jgi:hypothetical protein